MTYGLDTDFLVACEIVDHPFHQAADALLLVPAGFFDARRADGSDPSCQ